VVLVMPDTVLECLMEIQRIADGTGQRLLSKFGDISDLAARAIELYQGAARPKGAE
jgi:hypothetical protein